MKSSHSYVTLVPLLDFGDTQDQGNYQRINCYVLNSQLPSNLNAILNFCVSKTKYISDERFLFREKNFGFLFPDSDKLIKDSFVKELEL